MIIYMNKCEKTNVHKKGLFCRLFGCKKKRQEQPKEEVVETVTEEIDVPVTNDVKEPPYIKNAQGRWVDAVTGRYVKRETAEAWFAMDGK